MTVPSPSSQSRLAWIDTVKGFTIALVVLVQASYGVGDSLHHLPPVMTAIAEFAVPFRMPLFFLAAGLFAGSSLHSDWRSFIDKKIFHFGYFYLLWSLIELGSKIALGHGNYPVNIRDLELIPVEPFSSLWFIYALALFFTAMRLLRDVPKPLVFAFALLLYFVPVNTGWVIPDETAWRFIFFISGVYGAQITFDIAAWAGAHPVRAISLSLALFGCVGTAVFSGLTELRPVVFLMGYAGASASVMLAGVLAPRGLSKPLAYLGERSLYVYLAYFIPMAATRVALIALGIANADLIALASTLTGILLPLIAFRLVEHNTLSFLFIRPKFFRLEAERPTSKNSIPSEAHQS